MPNHSQQLEHHFYTKNIQIKWIWLASLGGYSSPPGSSYRKPRTCYELASPGGRELTARRFLSRNPEI